MAEAGSHRAGVMSGAVGFASRGMVQVMLFGVTVVATRTLSVAEFGAYALGSLLLVVARQLFYVGPYEYLLKAPDRAGLAGACLAANLVQSLVLAGLLGLAWVGARLFLADPLVAQILGLLIPSLFLVALAAWYEALLLRRVRVRRYYATTLAGDTAGAIAAVLLLLRGWGVAALVAQAYVRHCVLVMLYAGTTGQRPVLGGRGAMVEVLRWSRARYLAILLTFTSTYGGDFVLGLSLSPAATGLFRAASRIVTAMSDLFSQPLQKIAQTNLSASHARGRDSGTAWLTMLSGVGAIAWAGLVTLAFTARDLVPFALGAKWAPAVPVVIVFCLVKGFSLLDAVTTSFLVCHDRQRAMLKVQGITAAAVVALALGAAPLGTTAVAVAVGCATTGMSLTYWIMVVRISQADGAAIGGLARTAAPPVLAVAGVLALLAWLAPDLGGGPSILLRLSAAAVAFGLAVFAVRHRMLAAIGSLGHLPAAGPPLAVPGTVSPRPIPLAEVPAR